MVCATVPLAIVMLPAPLWVPLLTMFPRTVITLPPSASTLDAFIVKSFTLKAVLVVTLVVAPAIVKLFSLFVVGVPARVCVPEAALKVVFTIELKEPEVMRKSTVPLLVMVAPLTIKV
jgi:hypothetical protein